MTQPTTVGVELANLNPRLRAVQLAQADCPEHPGRQSGSCEPCIEQRRVDAREEERRDCIALASDRCTERFPVRYRDATTDRPDVLGWVEQFRADPANAQSLLLLGPTGTGKSHAGYAAVRQAVTVPLLARSGVYRSPRWQALTFADLIASLRPRGRDYDTEAVLGGYLALDLLFVDDLGAAKLSEFTEETTYRLINGRYEAMKPSIFTSNLGMADLKEAIGDRIASRLAETCTRVVLDGPDRRRQPQPTRSVPAPRKEPDPELVERVGVQHGAGPFWNN